MTPPVLAVIILLAIAAIHIAWALRIHWPAKSEAALARTVAGFAGVTTMPPPWSSLAVALLLTLGAYIITAHAGLMPAIAPAILYRLGLIVMTLVFALRGIAAWLPAWRRLTPEQPFATLDRRVFGPLCLLLSLLCALTLSTK